MAELAERLGHDRGPFDRRRAGVHEHQGFTPDPAEPTSARVGSTERPLPHLDSEP
jgi:hypothetical protein